MSDDIQRMLFMAGIDPLDVERYQIREDGNIVVWVRPVVTCDNITFTGFVETDVPERAPQITNTQNKTI